ncbi:unnamed protein product, partial [Choristocarpus tenellus]
MYSQGPNSAKRVQYPEEEEGETAQGEVGGGLKGKKNSLVLQSNLLIPAVDDDSQGKKMKTPHTLLSTPSLPGPGFSARNEHITHLPPDSRSRRTQARKNRDKEKKLVIDTGKDENVSWDHGMRSSEGTQVVGMSVTADGLTNPTSPVASEKFENEYAESCPEPEAFQRLDPSGGRRRANTSTPSFSRLRSSEPSNRATAGGRARSNKSGKSPVSADPEMTHGTSRSTETSKDEMGKQQRSISPESRSAMIQHQSDGSTSRDIPSRTRADGEGMDNRSEHRPKPHRKMSFSSMGSSHEIALEVARGMGSGRLGVFSDSNMLTLTVGDEEGVELENYAYWPAMPSVSSRGRRTDRYKKWANARSVGDDHTTRTGAMPREKSKNRVSRGITHDHAAIGGGDDGKNLGDVRKQRQGSTGGEGRRGADGVKNREHRKPSEGRRRERKGTHSSRSRSRGSTPKRQEEANKNEMPSKQQHDVVWRKDGERGRWEKLSVMVPESFVAVDGETEGAGDHAGDATSLREIEEAAATRAPVLGAAGVSPADQLEGEDGGLKLSVAGVGDAVDLEPEATNRLVPEREAKGVRRKSRGLRDGREHSRSGSSNTGSSSGGAMGTGLDHR